MVMLLVFFSERSRSDLGQAIKTRPPNRCCWRCCCSYCCCCGFCYAPMPALTQAIPIPIPIPRSDTHAPRWRRSVCNVLCLRLRLRLSVCPTVHLSISRFVPPSHCLFVNCNACLPAWFFLCILFCIFLFCFFFSYFLFACDSVTRIVRVLWGAKKLETGDWGPKAWSSETEKLRNWDCQTSFWQTQVLKTSF